MGILSLFSHGVLFVNEDMPATIFSQLLTNELPGEKSSITQKLIERIYGMNDKTNDKGPYLFYGKVGGCIITGNEDRVKHCALGILYPLQHVG